MCQPTLLPVLHFCAFDWNVCVGLLLSLPLLSLLDSSPTPYCNQNAVRRMRFSALAIVVADRPPNLRGLIVDIMCILGCPLFLKLFSFNLINIFIFPSMQFFNILHLPYQTTTVKKWYFNTKFSALQKKRLFFSIKTFL